MIFNAENFDIFRLGSVAVVYPPKNINTVALRVAAENIGALSLEFESELRYDADGSPYFNILVERGASDEMAKSFNLQVFEGDWIVILWNEIRIFREEEFKNTFEFDRGPDAVSTDMVDVNTRRAQIGLKPYPDLTGDVEKTQIQPAVGELQERPEIPQGNLDRRAGN